MNGIWPIVRSTMRNSLPVNALCLPGDAEHVGLVSCYFKKSSAHFFLSGYNFKYLDIMETDMQVFFLWLFIVVFLC